ncbi:MAG: MerR family transcriptional regulator [Pseudomonadota bacterium]
MKQFPHSTIAVVEREVGLSKDVLRVWERRYGFPRPERDANGERLYPADQVARLRLIKRYMDQGHRPGRLLTAGVEELEGLAQNAAAPAAQAADEPMGELIALVDLLRNNEAAAYVHALQQQLARRGLRGFVQDTVAPLSVQIGSAWQQGMLQVFEEHLFTELTTRVMRQAIAAVPGGLKPKVLLTTVPNEPHALGLLMLEAVLALEGAQCICLGTQLPLADIAQASKAHEADVVALSFSAAFAARQVPGLLLQLRSAMPDTVRLWAGGAGVRKLNVPPGVEVFTTLDEASTAVTDWQSQ